MLPVEIILADETAQTHTNAAVLTHIIETVTIEVIQGLEQIPIKETDIKDPIIQGRTIKIITGQI